jgi:hypothetical protein
MNPKKKKEIVDRVIFKYQLYKAAMSEYIMKNMKQTVDVVSETVNENPNDYYDSSSKTEMIKPNIYWYMNSDERRILKKIMEKKAGYENVDINKLPNKYKEKKEKAVVETK